MSATGNLLEKAIESAGGREEFRRKSKQYSDSVSFIDENRNSLLSEFDGSWVAVYNSKVVANGKDYLDVVKTIKRRKLPIEELVIKFISSRKIITLF